MNYVPSSVALSNQTTFTLASANMFLFTTRILKCLKKAKDNNIFYENDDDHHKIFYF